MNKEQVILVNDKDIPYGSMEKLEAHRKALMHRAVSVFIFNSAHQLLLQQRAHEKYHSGGLWTNTCCGHPRPGESAKDAAKRRLSEEMGLSCSLLPLFQFSYKAVLDHDLTEHEYDHVFIGFSDESPQPNPEEANDYRYVSIDALKRELQIEPQNYTAWFRLIMERPEINNLFTKKNSNVEKVFSRMP